MNMSDISTKQTDPLELHREMYERRLRKVQQQEQAENADGETTGHSNEFSPEPPKDKRSPERDR